MLGSSFTDLAVLCVPVTLGCNHFFVFQYFVRPLSCGGSRRAGIG